MQIGFNVEVIVEHARQAVFFKIGHARHGVEADLVRFEDGSESIIVRVRDGIVLVVVALGAVECEADERLTCVLDGGIKPGGAIEEIVVTCEETSGSNRLGIFRYEFVGGEHFQNHAVVALVFVQRFHNPIAPMPDVLLAVA